MLFLVQNWAEHIWTKRWRSLTEHNNTRLQQLCDNATQPAHPNKQQPPTVYTTTNPHGEAENTLATRVPLPMDERNAKLFQLKGAPGSTLQAGSGAPTVWLVRLVAWPMSAPGDFSGFAFRSPTVVAVVARENKWVRSVSARRSQN